MTKEDTCNKHQCICGETATVVCTDGAFYCYDCAVNYGCCPHCGEQF